LTSYNIYMALLLNREQVSKSIISQVYFLSQV